MKHLNIILPFPNYNTFISLLPLKNADSDDSKLLPGDRLKNSGMSV